SVDRFQTYEPSLWLCVVHQVKVEGQLSAQASGRVNGRHKPVEVHIGIVEYCCSSPLGTMLQRLQGGSYLFKHFGWLFE
ncbi:hypothetical protein HAX54_033856, partial [Datura stramonium]|nr:hypothetical protein [Datura stramonium]